MANKLDVYQVVLGKKAHNFKEFICKQCNIAETSTNQVVFNANGQLVINDVINGKRAVLPIVNLPDGIYSLILTQNSIANIVKFIVQH